MKKLVPFFLAAAFLVPALTFAAGGTVEQGGACTQPTQCAGNLSCLGGVCNIDYAACSAPCGSQNGSVQPGGVCAYNTDCADQGTTRYSCINAVCAPDQGTVSQGGTCTTPNDCAGNLSCISGVCQVDTSTLPGGSGAGGGAGNAPGAATGAGGINLTYLQGYKTNILTFINSILVPILISVAFIFFIWSIYLYFIQGAAEPKTRETGRTFALYAIIGFAIIFSLWGLVNLVTGTFNFGVGGSAASHGLTPPTL